MTSKEVRKKYIEFFKSAPRNHKEITPSPLVLENDPTTLFTSSGMQPLVPYLMGEPYPGGAKRLVDSQPSIRLQDIEEVGDNRHTTFFEMLGNWSLGDYFKKEQLPWFFEFLTKELSLPKERLWVSVFEGNSQVPKDDESKNIWLKLGIPEKRIFSYGVNKNWWSKTGTPEEMPIGEIGGPDSEVFFEFSKVKHDPKFGKECHPNCDCGRFLEIGNSVFIQYKKVGENDLVELPQKNVDFGGGLERTTAAVNDTPDIFQTDVFEGTIKSIEKLLEVKFGESEKVDKNMRIIADHLRASYMLISSGVYPSNKTQGYVLRRLIRRALLSAKLISNKAENRMPEVNFSGLGIPLELKDTAEVNKIIAEECEKFIKAWNVGIPQERKDLQKAQKNPEETIAEGVRPFGITTDYFITKNNLKSIPIPNIAAGTVAFTSLATYGIPMEGSIPVLKEYFPQAVTDDFNKIVDAFLNMHKEQSRTTSAGIFKGGLADHSPEVIKLHTATHILLASLRKVLGDHVVQRGQNITKERSRFDFPNPEKLNDKELKEVEDKVNSVIDKDLPVNFVILPKDEALATGAIHAFNEKYSDTVKVYFVGKSLEDAVSKEFCGGPHVTNTGEIGHVRIKKQEKIGSGVIRIYLVRE